jgi:hypothetical protein
LRARAAATILPRFMRATDVSRLSYPADVSEPSAPPVPAVVRAASRPDPVGSDDARPRAYARVLAFVDAHRYKLFLALAALYLLGFNGQWRPEPDSALYLSIGRNLALGEGYTYHGESHRLVFPGLPLVFAGLFKAFGTASLIPHHLVMLAMGAAALALTYRLFLLHAGRPMAVLVTLLVGVSQTFYRYNFELLTDLPFMLAVMAFLAGYEGIVHRHCADDPTPTPYPRGKPHMLDWALLLLGLATTVVMRPAMLALMVAVAGAAMWPILRGRFRWGSVAVFAVVIGAGVGFYVFDPREGGGDYERMLFRPDRFAFLWQRALDHNLPKLFDPTVAEAVFAVDFSDYGNILISSVLILTSFSLFRAHMLWGLLVVMTGVMLVAVEVHVRYLLFILPLLIYAWFRVLMYIDHKLPPRVGDRLFAAVLVLFVGTNLARVGDLVIEQRWPTGPLEKYKGGRFASLPELAEVVRDRTEPGAWVLVRHKLGRILTFTSGRNAVEPNAGTQLDPAIQPVYVLDPVDSKEEDKLDTRTRDWMAAHGVTRGAEVVTVQGERDRQPWVLSRAVKATEPGK